MLFVVFTGRFKIFSEGIKEASLNCDSGCKSVGYMSGTVETQDCSGGRVKILGRFEGMSENQICCCTPK